MAAKKPGWVVLGASPHQPGAAGAGLCTSSPSAISHWVPTGHKALCEVLVDKVGRDSKLNKTWPSSQRNLQSSWRNKCRKMPREGFLSHWFWNAGCYLFQPLWHAPSSHFSYILHAASSLVNIYTSLIIITEKGPGGRGSPGFRQQDNQIYRTKARNVFWEEPILQGQSEVSGREGIRRYVSE